MMVNACRIAAARRITAILPYFPYAKMSKRKSKRGSLTAKCNVLYIINLQKWNLCYRLYNRAGVQSYKIYLLYMFYYIYITIFIIIIIITYYYIT